MVWGDSQRFEATCRARVIEAPSCTPKPKDRRRLSELISLWYNLHGRDGKRRLSKLEQVAVRLRNSIARLLDASDYSAMRRKRLDAGVSPKTMNNELGYIRAVFNELRDLGQLDYDNSLASVKPLKLQERELSWLTLDQIGELLDAICTGCENPHTELVTLLCLATGARWSEAEKLPQTVLRGMSSPMPAPSQVRSVPSRYPGSLRIGSGSTGAHTGSSRRASHPSAGP